MKYKVAFVLLVLSPLLASSFFGAACRQITTSTTPAAPVDVSVHKSEIQKWQSDRLASLTKEDGWLTLVGLFWLNEGENKFGSDPGNPIVLPKDKAPPIAGSLWLENDRVRLAARPGDEITVDG